MHLSMYVYVLRLITYSSPILEIIIIFQIKSRIEVNYYYQHIYFNRQRSAL